MEQMKLSRNRVNDGVLDTFRFSFFYMSLHSGKSPTQDLFLMVTFQVMLLLVTQLPVLRKFCYQLDSEVDLFKSAWRLTSFSLLGPYTWYICSTLR